jgi:glycerol uptake facilitator protein
MVSLGKKLAAELLGTFLLVFFGSIAIYITLTMVYGGSTPNPFNIGVTMTDWLGINMAFGLAIIIGIYSFARISGAHFNPAVTLALWSVQRFPGKNVAPYISAQLIGATIASLLFALFIGSQAISLKLGATAPYTIGYLQAIMVEAMGTFLLMMTIMVVAVDKRAKLGYAGLIIGLSVILSQTLISSITGGSINPAGTFGPYLGDTILGSVNLWNYFPIYVIGPISGAIMAAFTYKYIKSESNKNLLTR